MNSYNESNLCPACLSSGKLKYPEKIEDKLFKSLEMLQEARQSLDLGLACKFPTTVNRVESLIYSYHLVGSDLM